MDKIPLPDPRDSASPISKGSVGNGQRVTVLFHLGSESLAVDSSAVREIAFMARLSAPPRLPSVLAGFLNLAGRSIPIIRLHRLFDIPEPAFGFYTQILILRDGDGNSVGWIVDRVACVAALNETDIMAVPENECFKDCAKGVFTFSGDPVTLIAPERVLLEKERQRIAEFQRMEQERLRELEHSEA
jgi:purine-binding chemotaxis protein CheW